MCDPETLSAGKSIQWIQLVTAGVENCVSIPAVKERNILVTNMQRIAGPVIAEHVIAMTLGLARGLDVYIPAQAQGKWIPRLPPGRATTVDGKTMLVVGLGGIGTEVAKRAHALGMKVTATRNSGRTGPDFVSYVGLADELPKLASEADVVVNTAPLTPQTKGIFNAALFAKMKPTAYFINIARGGSVVTSDLVDALNNKTIAGAGLDVTDPEPLPPGHPLWKAPNLIITPHVSADSDLGGQAPLQVVRENLKRYAAGDKMLSVVDVARRAYSIAGSTRNRPHGASVSPTLPRLSVLAISLTMTAPAAPSTLFSPAAIAGAWTTRSARRSWSTATITSAPSWKPRAMPSGPS